MDRAERDALLTLTLTPGLGQTLIGRCVERFGSAQDALDAGAGQLAQVQGISAAGARKIRDGLSRVHRESLLEREVEAMQRHRVSLIALGDPDYPKLLRHIPDPPRLLWVGGELEETDALGLAIVGSRRCSHYGREQAERFGAAAARAGLCVVSGGAYGIDAAAHRGALNGGGRTIVVLGSGLGDPYPKDHVELFAEIADRREPRGAVISELPMSSPPLAEHFPRRNRIVSGLSLGTLMIEAAPRSGALITARLCVEEHGRELMALPGRVDSTSSAGCHKAIREGWATLVTGIADVLDALGEAGQMLKAQAPPEDGPGADAPVLDQTLSESQKAIIGVVDAPRSLDQIVAFSGLSVQQVQSDLTMLELRGALRRNGGLFVRS